MRQTTVLRRGAILYQKQDGKMRVIAYASRTLTPPKKNYAHAGKLEFLALKWVITVDFAQEGKQWLKGNDIWLEGKMIPLFNVLELKRTYSSVPQRNTQRTEKQKETIATTSVRVG